MTKNQVKKEIDNIITVCIANAFSISIIQHPIGKKAKKEIYPSNNTTVEFGRKKEKTFKIYQIEETLEKFDKNPINNINYLIYPLMSATALIHDIIIGEKLNKKTPEFEFLRHLRNAFSHGNEFTLRESEPSRPAKFGDFEINRSLNGKRNVLIDYIKPGDVLDLLEHIKENI